MNVTGRARSLRQSVAEYLDRRLLVIFLFGISSGYPWVLTMSAMNAWLQESGLTRSAIGFFGAITTVYAINFLWAPFVDRVELPLLSRLGQRRSWILTMQAVMALCAFAIAQTDPATDVGPTAVLALVVALCSATQDVAIDAYRIEVIPRSEEAKISHGSAMATAGWWSGYAGVGAVPFFIADLPAWSWDRVYLVLALLWLPFLLATLLATPAPQRRDRMEEAERAYEAELAGGRMPTTWQKIGAWLAVTVVEPFRDFFERNGVKLALGILAFVFLFKIGEAFLGRMSIVFYKEIGFTDAQIGTYSKLVTWWLTIVFSIVASVVNARFGLVRGLLVSGVAMAASNLMFSWIAVVGPHEGIYAAAVIVDGFTQAMGTVAFVAFISFLTSHTYTATQYALLASLATAGRTAVASFSGLLVDWMEGNWAFFFVLTALMVIPSLIILVWLGTRLKDQIPAWGDARAA